ncbi:MAG: AMP-binding protein, partial [bacterium]|nr:AMP-binding protein [bacterium]
TNEMLRTIFRWKQMEKPVQIILKEHLLTPVYYDITPDKSNRKSRLQEIKNADKQKKFDLSTVPFRVTLCKTAHHKHEMIISNHHIIYDGWSSGIILGEFFDAYNNLENGKQPGKINKSSFKEFIKRIKNPENKNKQNTYWKNYLQNLQEPGREIPEKRTIRNKRTTRREATILEQLPENIATQTSEFVKKYKITQPSLLLSAWGLLLQTYNNTKDILFDTTVSGRTAKVKGIEQMVGLFIDTIPLRVRTGENEEVAEFLNRLYKEQQTRQEYENTAGIETKELFEEKKRYTRFDTVTVIENYPLDRQLMQEKRRLTVDNYNISGQTHYDITLLITTFDKIELHITYDKKIFDKETIEKITRQYIHIIQELIENPHKRITDIGADLQPLEIPGEQRLNETQKCTAPQPGAMPSNTEEKRLAAIWAEVLKIEKETIGIDDDFFDYGGHSLRASIAASRIHREFNVKLPLAQMFETPTIRELAQYITGAQKERYLELEPARQKNSYPLSSAQKRMYMLQQMDPQSTAYNGPTMMKLETPAGTRYLEKFEDTFNALIRRHEILRTGFHQEEGEPVQRIHPPGHHHFKIDYYETDETGQPATGKPGIISTVIRPFDLTEAPLLRVAIIKTGTGPEHDPAPELDKYILIVDMHHIVTDGTSLDIFIREFVALYRGEELPEVKHHYKDYSEWQNRRLDTGELKPHEDYWMENFCGEHPVLNMPLDYPRPPYQQYEGAHLNAALDPQLTAQLKTAVRETGTTLYIYLMAVYSVLLAKYARQEEIIIGSATAGRTFAYLEEIMGLLLETIAIRTYPQETKTFGAYLKEMKTTVLNAFKHQEYPFREMIKQVGNENDRSRNPLFDAMLIVQNVENEKLELEGFNITPHPYEAGIAKVDLTLEAMETGTAIEIKLEYSTVLYREETMQRFLAHFVNLLGQVVQEESRHRQLPELEIIDTREKQRILQTFNSEAVEYNEDRPVHQLFSDQVQRTPHRICLIATGGPPGRLSGVQGVAPPGTPIDLRSRITYRELDVRTDKLAAILIEKGVKTGDIVAVMVNPSIGMMIVLLGILKAGAAYLP